MRTASAGASLGEKAGDQAAGGLGAQGVAAGGDAAADDLRIVPEQQETPAEEGERRLAVFAQVALESSYEGDQAVVTDADPGGEQAAVTERADDLVGEDALGNDQR